METFKFGAVTVTDHCFQSLENKICEIFIADWFPVQERGNGVVNSSNIKVLSMVQVSRAVLRLHTTLLILKLFLQLT